MKGMWPDKDVRGANIKQSHNKYQQKTLKDQSAAHEKQLWHTDRCTGKVKWWCVCQSWSQIYGSKLRSIPGTALVQFHRSNYVFADLPIKAADFKANAVLAGEAARGRQGFSTSSVQVFPNDGQDGAEITEGPSTTKTPDTGLPPPPSPSFPILQQLFPLPAHLHASPQAPALPTRSDEPSAPTTPTT